MAGKVETITLKVERKSKYGILFNNNWFSVSKFGEADLDQFEVGKSYHVVVNYSKEGKAYIDKIVGASSEAPAVPAMPKTRVEETKAAITGNSPVAAAGTGGTSADSLTVRDIYMAAQAAMKSTLESPTVHYLATTLPEDEVPALIRKYAKLGVDIVLEVVAEKKG